ncbi:hypothetical protein DIPPA_14638 [Diplonema papillatum]|nr:hypothetical protein DIPPA_14638 [Diplonema papillatum]|eukprot:gene5507-8382_t
MSDGLTITVVNTLSDNKATQVTVYASDTQTTLYEKAAEAAGLKADTFSLEYQTKKIEKDTKPISETELEDSCEVHITLSGAEKAKMELKKLGKEVTVNTLCEACAEGDLNLVDLLIDAGVDVNGRYES